MAQPTERGSPDIEALSCPGKGSTSAGHQDRNKKGSLVQTWALGGFGERAQALRLNRPMPQPKATLQRVTATTDGTLTGLGIRASPALFHLSITATYKGETDYSYLTGGKTEALWLYNFFKVIYIVPELRFESKLASLFLTSMLYRQTLTIRVAATLSLSFFHLHLPCIVVLRIKWNNI